MVSEINMQEMRHLVNKGNSFGGSTGGHGDSGLEVEISTGSSA
jgi:hypothetical protein